ncbi:hypothetical protein ACQ5SK_27365 [Bradyrhizobium japonicum]
MAAENKNAGKTDNVQPKTVGLGKSAELSLRSLGASTVFFLFLPLVSSARPT